jgi:tRNA wybutosine-synthesizing protein 4
MHLAEFCLLEQILPAGQDHPFAKTMLHHFVTRKSPLKSVHTYPDVATQHSRFSKLGWSRVDVNSLWQIWSNEQWLTSQQRRDLDSIEPFDEWEEFALFASHYCVVSATNTPGTSVPPSLDEPILPLTYSSLQISEYKGTRGRRRFGSPVTLRNQAGDLFIANTFGSDTNSRSRSLDLYTQGNPMEDIKISSSGPGNRMCHSMVSLGSYGSLLVGGRRSPSEALQDCWLLDRASNSWSRVDNLPTPLYRHGMTRLGRTRMALILGGKTSSTSIFAGCLLYRPGKGWMRCEISGTSYTPVFGAVFACLGQGRFDLHEDRPTSQEKFFHGALLGGMSIDGIVATQALRWELLIPADGKPALLIFRPWTKPVENATNDKPATGPEVSPLLCRFGASAHIWNDEKLLVVGGVSGTSILPKQFDIIALDVRKAGSSISGFTMQHRDEEESAISRPLLIGTSATLTKDGLLLVMGGGATCFSMGTYWNPGCYAMRLGEHSENTFALQESWHYSGLAQITGETRDEPDASVVSRPKATKVDITRVRVPDAASFGDIVRASKPVIIEGTSLGSCADAWTTEYLTTKIGNDRKVIVPLFLLLFLQYLTAWAGYRP